MINYRLKDNVVTHFPAIFKGLGSKGSVIHMALDVELHGGVLAVRVAGADQLIVASVAAARSLIWQGSSSGGETGWCIHVKNPVSRRIRARTAKCRNIYGK